MTNPNPLQPSAPAAMVPPIIVPGQNLDLAVHPAESPAAATVVIQNPAVRAQIDLTDDGIDQLIVRLEEIRRNRRGLTVVADLPDEIRNARH